MHSYAHEEPSAGNDMENNLHHIRIMLCDLKIAPKSYMLAILPDIYDFWLTWTS